MRTETKYVLFLLIGGPVFGELLNGNHNPLHWILNPMAFVGDVMLYGCGALLIHELRARWKLQWAVILLSVAYAIIEEGLATKAFFNPNWNNGEYATYGNYFGVKWAWAIGVGFYHSTISVLGPIFAASLLWPACSRKSLLRDPGLIAATFFFWLIVVGHHYTLGEGVLLGTVFFPHPIITLYAALVVAALIVGAWLLRGRRVRTSGPLLRPWAFGIVGFAVPFILLFVGWSLKDNNVAAPVTIVFQLSVIALALVFGALQVLNDKVTPRHHASLLAGAIAFYLALLPLHIAWGKPDMVLVFVAGIIALIWWFRRVAPRAKATVKQ